MQTEFSDDFLLAFLRVNADAGVSNWASRLKSHPYIVYANNKKNVSILRKCTGLPETLLLEKVINTQIASSGSFIM